MAVRVRRWSDVEARRVERPFPHGTVVVGGGSGGAGAVPVGRGSLVAAATPATAATAAPAASASVTLSVVEDELCAPDECVICLDELTAGRAIFTAECGHRFHFTCLLENVNHDEANADKCPICRKAQAQWPEQTKGLVKAHPYCASASTHLP